jgi:hypothetical protein
MAPRFSNDPNRVNRTVAQSGKEYNLRLLRRANATLTTLMDLLPSNYISSVQGPNYTNELKAVAVEIAKLELALEDVDTDTSFAGVRSDFLYSVVGYLVFLNGRMPATSRFDDVEFKRFLSSVIKIYFQGSIPTSIREGVGLFVSGNVTVTEDFLLVRAGASGMDVSDQFSFRIDLDMAAGVPSDLFTLDTNLRLVLDILRPAHTLFRIRYIFKDSYTPNADQGGKILDAYRWRMASYYYEDYRAYGAGVRDRNRLGVKMNLQVTDEDHSDDF